MNNNLIGTRLGKYEIQAEIGRGGMGTVYKGYDPALDRYVAVKVLAPHLVWEKEFVERFLREARAAARLDHPGLVTIYDVGQEADWYYFVMQYLEGQPLTEIIQQRGAFPPNEVLSILRSLAEALDYAHRKGLVHRDIKPGNIIVSLEGQVTLTDFGIARAAQETRLTTTGTMIGTPQYMSPEQAKGLTVDVRSDQYSLGVVAYEMLSGEVPFDAESTLALLHKVAYDPLPPIRQARPDLPVGVEAVLAKALAKEPGERYATLNGFVDALGRALAGEGVPADAVAPAVEPPTVVREPGAAAIAAPGVAPVPTPATAAISVAKPIPARQRVPVWVWALGGLAVLALVMGVVMALRDGEGQPTGETITTADASTITTAAASSLKIHPIFVSNRDGKQEIYHLTEGGEVEQITYTPGDAESWSPVLAADGTILFTSNRDGKWEIYHIAKGGDVERVTHTPGNAESWSPVLAADGTILFTSDRDGKREIYHTAKGGEVERVTHTPGNAETWSSVLAADGTILFTSDRDGKQEIYHIAKGGEVEQIPHTPSDAESWSPVLAADGTILFTSDRDGKREIYHIAKGGEAERVTRTPDDAESWAPVLAADGSILFTSDRDGKREIYHTAKGGEVKQITYTRGNGESWSPAW